MLFLKTQNGQVVAAARQWVLNKKVPSDTIFFGRQGFTAPQGRPLLLLEHFRQKWAYFEYFLSGFWPLKWFIEVVEAIKWHQQIGHDHRNSASHQPKKSDKYSQSKWGLYVTHFWHWHSSDFRGWLHFQWPQCLIITPHMKCLNGFGVLRYVEIAPKRSRADQFF